VNTGLIVIAGGTGFIGRALAQSLGGEGYEVAILTRNRDKAKAVFGDQTLPIEWDGRTPCGWLEVARRGRAIINLAGENIGSGRWTEERKTRLIASRLDAGRAVVAALAGTQAGPKTLIQASAVGYYGSRGEEELDESASPGGGFLAELVREWENSTSGVEEFNTRRVVIRSGLVLGRNGGVLPRFLRQYRFFAGGPLGSGQQVVSWIHLEDEVRAIRFLLEREDLSGVFNLTSPKPVSMKEFARTLARMMNRPALFRVPGLLLRLLFGQMAEETLLGGQKVVPRALLGEGFEFLYPDLDSALRAILKR
jgi:uncharacterized protein (TIGR01777 family)